MKNQEIIKKSKSSAKDQLSNGKIDAKNADNAMKNIESLLKDIPKKGNSINSQSLYRFNPELHIKFNDIKSWDEIKSKGLDKNYRNILRKKLNIFANDILGKDRNMQEKKDAKKSFMQFFKENYISEKLDSSSIYQGNNEMIRKDYSDMIQIIELI